MSKVRFAALFGAVMPLFYLALAATLAFTRLFAAWVNGPAAYAFAGAFFLYGVFRIYRLFKQKSA